MLLLSLYSDRPSQHFCRVFCRVCGHSALKLTETELKCNLFSFSSFVPSLVGVYTCTIVNSLRFVWARLVKNPLADQWLLALFAVVLTIVFCCGTSSRLPRASLSLYFVVFLKPSISTYSPLSLALLFYIIPATWPLLLPFIFCHSFHVLTEDVSPMFGGYKGFARQPCCMARTMDSFPMGKNVHPNAKHFHCSCHATWLPCKTSIIGPNGL